MLFPKESKPPEKGWKSWLKFGTDLLPDIGKKVRTGLIYNLSIRKNGNR